LKHPLLGSHIIERDLHAPIESAAIVLQHHELPKRVGFPNKLPAQKIMPFAAILEVSIDFSQYILENPKWLLEEYVPIAKMKFTGGIFSKIVRALAKFQIAQPASSKQSSNTQEAV